MEGGPGGPPIAAGGDMGGMGGAPGGAGGGPIVAKSTALSAEVADPSQFGGKILKKRNRERFVTEQQKIYNRQHKQQVDSFGQQRDEKGRIIFTKPERELIAHLTRYIKDGLIRYPIQPQYRLNTAGEEYPIDFAIVPLRLGIEADGEMFHGQPEQKSKDKERDMKLAQIGWTILRFKDHEIEESPQQVMTNIVQEIMKKEMSMKQQYSQMKKAEHEAMIKESAAIHDELEEVNKNVVVEFPPDVDISDTSGQNITSE
jgi:very-short-patch-repair endonuclease